MRTATVVLVDGNKHPGMILRGVDNGGSAGLNFSFVGAETGDRLYRNENEIQSITWVEEEPYTRHFG